MIKSTTLTVGLLALLVGCGDESDKESSTPNVVKKTPDAEPSGDYYIVLDMGADNTTLLVSNGKKIWIRNVPIGGTVTPANCTASPS